MVCQTCRTPSGNPPAHSRAGSGFCLGSRQAVLTHRPHAEISKISHRGGKKTLEVPMQAQFFSKKGERFDTCYNPRGWNAILISDTHTLSCSFVSKKGFAAREMCLMRLFWTWLEFPAAPAAPAALETITPARGAGTALGAAEGTFSYAKQVSGQGKGFAAGRSAQSKAHRCEGAQPRPAGVQSQSHQELSARGCELRADPGHPPT